MPFCLQPILKDQIEALVSTVEMTAVPKAATPVEYRRYVRECDQEAK